MEEINNTSLSRTIKKPFVECLVCDQRVKVLIDTGAEISCISEEFYLNLNVRENGILQLPLTGILLQGAMGNKSRMITKQVQLDLRFGSWHNTSIFMVVPKLIRPMILGIEWLSENAMNLDFKKGVMYKDSFLCPFIDKLIERKDSFLPPTGKVKIVGLCDNLFENKKKVQLVQTEEPLDISERKSPLTLEESVESSTKLDFPDYLKNKNENLNEIEKKELQALLLNDKLVFNDRPGLTNKYEHKIIVNDISPYYQKQYPIPFAHRPHTDKQISEMEKEGVIVRSETQYINPLVTVVKSPTEIRLCMDARFLNSRMVKDYEKPPIFEEITVNLGESRFFSTLDLSSAY